jgi:hypothetical protein
MTFVLTVLRGNPYNKGIKQTGENEMNTITSEKKISKYPYNEFIGNKFSTCLIFSNCRMQKLEGQIRVQRNNDMMTGIFNKYDFDGIKNFVNGK